MSSSAFSIPQAAITPPICMSRRVLYLMRSDALSRASASSRLAASCSGVAFGLLPPSRRGRDSAMAAIVAAPGSTRVGGAWEEPQHRLPQSAGRPQDGPRGRTSVAAGGRLYDAAVRRRVHLHPYIFL